MRVGSNGENLISLTFPNLVFCLLLVSSKARSNIIFKLFKCLNSKVKRNLVLKPTDIFSSPVPNVLVLSLNVP